MSGSIRWLMRADARKVFHALAAALILVTAWRGWREFAPVYDETPIMATPARERPVSSLGIVAFLDRPASRESASANLFRPGKSVSEAAPKHRAAKSDEAKASAPKSKPDSLSLTYRGMLRGTDGKIMALIEDSGAKTTAFYSIGQELRGNRVGEIGEQSVGVRRPNGEEVVLKIGAPENL